MGYLHILSLYKEQTVLLFRRVFALEKVHGTSTHVAFNGHSALRDGGDLTFHNGGVSAVNFAALFKGASLDDPYAELVAKFVALGHAEVVVYGEGYGGSCQGQSHRYGKSLRFIAFDVKVGETWLSVKDAEQVVLALGLEFVPYEEIDATLEAFDAARDAPSVVAERNGMGVQQREGVVLRPLKEMTLNNGERVICKHRIEEFNERASPQKIVSAEKLAVLTAANAIADEWVTPNRLTHVLDKLAFVAPVAVDSASTPQPREPTLSDTRTVISAMVEDVYREAKGEIVQSKDAEVAIGRRTAILFKARIEERHRASIGSDA